MTDLLLLAAGIVVVVIGADLFFDGLMSVSSRMKTAPFVITVILSGFEIENLAAGIAANANDLPGAAAGTFLGGTTFLALGVTGFAAVMSPLEARLPWQSLMAAAASPSALLVLALDGQLSRIDGALLLAWFVLIMVVIAWSGRGIVSEHDEGDDKTERWSILRLIGGIAALTMGGEVLGEGIRGSVSRFGVSQSLLGNTVIAASVEAEEIARVAVPAKRGRADVALGNIIGTVAHFVAFNAGVIALVQPLAMDGVSRQLHLPVAVISVVLVSLLIAVTRRVSRLQGGFLLLLYATYVAIAIAVAIT
jgi:cation:H+ antiporter